MLARVQEIYGKIPGTPIPPLVIPPDPPLSAEKKIEVRGPGETTYLVLAYRAPAASEPDFFAVSVLDSLFTGPSSLNMFGGGGISNKTSRLYRALVEQELAVTVNAGLQATMDPYLYPSTLLPDRRLDQRRSLPVWMTKLPACRKQGSLKRKLIAL